MPKLVVAIVLAVSVACASERVDQEAIVAEVTADVLAGAARALGGAATVGVQSIYTAASATGPSGDFETHVWSHRDGRARMSQTTGFDAGIDRDSAWARNSDGTVSSLNPGLIPFVRGHELHARTLFPNGRLNDATFLGRDIWDGDTVLVVRFTDESANPFLLAYSTTDTLPRGFRVMSEEPNVLIRLGNWIITDDVRVFTTAEFRQGDEVFRYEFTTVELNGVADSTFHRPQR